MNRLVRIAVILLASGPLMMSWAQDRLALVERIHSSGVSKSGNLGNEIQKGYVGLSMGGLMVAAGLGLIVTAVIRSRKQPKLVNHE